MKPRSIFAIVAAAALTLPGCERQSEQGDANQTTAADVKREIGQAVDTARKYALERRDEFVQAMSQRLDELERQIERLEQQARQAGQEASEELEQRLERLQQRQQQLRERLDRVAASGSEAWEDMKDGLQRAVDELEQASQQAASRFDQAPPEVNAPVEMPEQPEANQP